MLRLKAWI